MIDNIVLIITGTLHDRSVEDLLGKCHPLGLFDSVAMAGKCFSEFSFKHLYCNYERIDDCKECERIVSIRAGRHATRSVFSRLFE